MRKSLLTLAALALTMQGFAQSAGEYVYSDEGKFQITTGTNLLTNGDFNSGTEGWTTDTGGALNVDTFSVEDDGGDLCLKVYYKENGPGKGSSLLRSQPVYAGKAYVISYSVKAQEPVTTTIVTGDNVKNYQNIFFNYDGSINPVNPIATSQSYDLEWKTISYTYVATETGFITFHFYAPYVGSCFDNFKVLEAEEVIDDRESEKVLAQLQAYLDNPFFPNGHEIIEEYMGGLKAICESGDLTTYESMVSQMEEVILYFLDENSVDITANVPNGNFDDLPTTKADQRKAGAWTIDDLVTGKSRWAVKSAEEQGAPFTGNFLQDNYTDAKYILRRAIVSQTVENMPAAQFMFTIKARATFLPGGVKYFPGRGDLHGIKVFANNDSTECWPIASVEATEYTVYTKMEEAGNLTLGVFLPDSLCHQFDFDVTSLRIIGWTADQVDEFFLGKEFAEARAALKAIIDEAKALKTDSIYLYGMAELQHSIDSLQGVYDTGKLIEDFTAGADSLQKAITAFKHANAKLLGLHNAIAAAEAALADDAYPYGKEALAAAIAVAKEYLGQLTAENHEEEAYTNDAIALQTQTLKSAVNDLILANIVDDEKYPFMVWAAAEGAEYSSSLDLSPDTAIATNGYASDIYLETAQFAGHDLNGRLAFVNNSKLTLSLQPSSGLQVNFSGKNTTTMAILNLGEGDRVTLDWAMANSSHGVMVSSANVKYTTADGTEVELTKTGKQTENTLPKDNTNGLSGSTRTVFTMTKAGTLDLYQYNSNSALRIYYLGITKYDPAQGIEETVVEVAPRVADGIIYDLCGRRVNKEHLTRGIYIVNGKKFVVR